MRIQKTTDKPAERLRVLRFADLVRLGIFTNRNTCRRHVAQGLFPAPIAIGANQRAWPETEVAAWYEKKLQEREELVARWRGDA